MFPKFRYWATLSAGWRRCYKMPQVRQGCQELKLNENDDLSSGLQLHTWSQQAHGIIRYHLRNLRSSLLAFFWGGSLDGLGTLRKCKNLTSAAANTWLPGGRWSSRKFSSDHSILPEQEVNPPQPGRSRSKAPSAWIRWCKLACLERESSYRYKVWWNSVCAKAPVQAAVLAASIPGTDVGMKLLDISW